ncbi:MAG: hypothetical protein ACXAC5_02090 [Promethearchaeota archaeon]|jgi:hypothetical protein
MKTTIQIPTVVCKNGTWHAYGYGTSKGVDKDVDTALMYESWDPKKVPDTDLQMVTVTVEIDVDALFKEKTFPATVEKLHNPQSQGDSK